MIRTKLYMDKNADLAAERTHLQLTSRHLAGHGPIHPSDEFEAIADWLKNSDDERSADDPGFGPQPDVYGTGPLVEDFEREVAALFDMPAARFMPSGCMAQPIALRIWSDRVGNPNTAFHPTSHLQLHEEFGYRELHGLCAYLLGDAKRPTTAADLKALIGPGGLAEQTRLASLLVELPAREIGGQLPSWSELTELSALCRELEIRLHLDGARVWQAAPAYGRDLKEIAALFDSVYISFYKDVGALPGAMLLGPEDFIEEAKVWQRRQGGTLFSAMANIVSARRKLGPCLERMPTLVERARDIAALFGAHDWIRVMPDPPHTSMFHVLLRGELADLLDARDHIARKTGIWLFNNLQPAEGELAARAEISLGPSSLTISNDELAAAIKLLVS